MDNFSKAIDSIKEKIGEENVALVSDELAEILSSHQAEVESGIEKDKEIGTLKSDKESLVNANAKLFQRLGFDETKPTTFDRPVTPEKEVEPLKISDIINDKGDII